MLNQVTLDAKEGEKAYKIMVDLKPFNGDEKCIKVKVNPDRVMVSGSSQRHGRHSESDVSFMQNFSLPRMIDTDDVTKVKRGDQYIITLPFED